MRLAPILIAPTIIVLVTAIGAPAQNIMNPASIPPALLDFEGSFRDLPLQCEVTPIQPSLNFGFRFQAGYVVSVPMVQFRGPGHTWAIMTRIRPEGDGRQPVYLGNRYRLPDVPPTRVSAEVGGAYLLGAGRYQVAWKLMDETGRVCRKEWTVDARLSRADRQVKVAMQPGTIAELSLRGASRHPTDDAAPIRLTVLLHAAPTNPRRIRMGARDRVMLLGLLSSLLERVPVRAVKLVVFNLDQQKEIYRAETFAPQYLNQVARAIDAVELGLVDYRVLQNRDGHLDMLAGLINAELSAATPADLVLFVGPLARTTDKPPADELDKPASAAPRFIYLQYRSVFYQEAAMPDSISRTVGKLKGKTLVVHTPRDFAKAIEQVERQPAQP